MLLSTCSSSTASAVDDELSNPISEYLQLVSGQGKDQDVISADHCYSKLWSSHPEAHHNKPARLLFLKSLYQRNDFLTEVCDIPVDVETVDSPIVPPYDNEKSRELFSECDQFLLNCLPAETSEEKEALNKTEWTPSQRNIYKHAMKILQGNCLSRLASSGCSSELVKRRVNIDKGASKMRQLFAANTWDMKLLGWLHRTFLDHLSIPLLSEYFEILKTLKAKVPSLIDKMLSQFGSFHLSLFGTSSAEAFMQLLRKPWDPVLNALTNHKLNKLPGNPSILIVPGSPNQTVANQSQRMRFWNTHLSSLAKVIHLPVHASTNIAVDESLNQIFTLARNKVVEINNHSPKRPTILLGWNVGALIACHVALEESVTAVICLGFPFKGVSGPRGDLDDPLLDSKVPTLFVIGQNSSTCSMDDIEDFRERMRAETGLVVVGGADDMLRVSVTKKRSEGITQSMVDRCLMDEIADFLTPILTNLFSSPPASHAVSHPVPSKKPTFAQEQQVTEEGKRPRRRPREYSPEISPVRKKSRPVGRPSLQKVLSSSSSSDSSSVGSYANEHALRKGKSFVLQKPKRHTEQLSRLQKMKNSIECRPKHVESKKEKVIDEVKTNPKESTVAAPQPSTSTKVNPAKMLADQQKNGPVDVEKAFGKDSSFLPRPLTPAEFDGNDTVLNTPAASEKPAELTDPSSAAALENEELLPSVLNTPVATSKPVCVSLASILGSPERQKISYLKTSIGNYPLTTFSTHVSSTVAIQKPQVVAKISESVFDPNKTSVMPVQKLQSSDISVASVSLSNTISQSKILKSSTCGVSVKHMQNLVALSNKSLIATSSASSPKSQPVVGSQTANKPATFLVQSNEASSPAGKIQLRRMLVQGPSKFPVLSKTLSEETKPSSEHRPCNLSLLSDVAGMKEPIRQMGHDTQNATLVKLTSSGDSGQSLKRIRVIEALPSSSSSSLQRLETPEELAEKQMAIRALSSLNEEGDSSFNSYHIQSSKMEGNYISRSSTTLGYSVVMPRPVASVPTRNPFRRGRGRSLAGFPMERKPRVQRFYPF